MSVSVEESSPLSEGQSTTIDQTISKSSSEGVSLDKQEDEKNDSSEKTENVEKVEPDGPKLHPMAFTIDFGENKQVDNRRLEELAKKSQARHQRVQSMSASISRPIPAAQKPPMSAKLPRKAQGYNSEGYFSSDQEDSGLSGSVKLRNSPLHQNITSPISNRHIKSPEAFQTKRTSKSPIVDSIMSRSDNFTNRHGLNLPLKNANSSYLRDVHRTPSYGSLSCQPRPMDNIIDNSPEGVMLTDISSPELDILTPDNGLSTPELTKSPLSRKVRAQSETPDLLFQKCTPKVEALYIDDDIDRQSNNSSTGTYTIEGDNYTEEQKARMSIDRTFGTDLLDGAISKSLKKRASSHSSERDPELIFDYPNRVITKEPRRDIGLRSTVASDTTFDMPVSKDKNVLEISCCYESPTENDLAAQTSKQIKSTRSYLEKIKNRVRTITEKTFAKSPPKPEPDYGNFTSVTTSGVLSSKTAPKLPPEFTPRRRCSLTKSEIDQTDYIHRLSRESSVPVNLPSSVPLAFDNAKFESTAMKNAQKVLRDDSGVSSDITPEQVVGKLSYLSLNRCKGDKTWIQDWADSVKKYNNNELVASDSNCTFVVEDRPPLSPRHVSKPRSPVGATPCKIPSPVGTMLSRRTPDLIPQQDTESYLLKTQSAITNLQAKLHSSRTNNLSSSPNQLTSSLISEKTAASRLPVSQLSRSNSLNYRLRRKETDSSPLHSPGHYVITGSSKLPESTRILINNASRSLDTDRRKNSRDSNMNSPSSDRGLLSNSSDDKTLSNRPQYDVEAILSPHRKTHARHRSFDGRNPIEHFIDNKNANEPVCLKTVLKNNALESKYPRIDQTRCLETKTHQRVFSDGNKQLKHVTPFNSNIKRSSSFNTVNRNNNYIEPAKINSRRSSGNTDYKDHFYLSDESETDYDKDRYKRHVLNRGRIDSPDLKSKAPANSPRCPNTPEMQRKFGPGLVRNSVRVTNKERLVNSRMSEPPVSKEERKPVGHQSRRILEPTRQSVMNRLTKSRSSTREMQPKTQEKGPKRPSQHRSSSALASKEIEFSNWKKRSSYDPMKAAQEGRKKALAKRQECNKDDLSSPSHSSPVHRSQSFHTTNIASLTLDYSSEETEDEQSLPADPMITSTHSDIADLLRVRERQPLCSDIAITRVHVTGFQVNQPPEKLKANRQMDKRKTFIIDDITPTKENIDFLTKDGVDKRKTFILDSDTNSTTNGSSPRNSSIFSHEKASLTTGTSDTECESGPESTPVTRRPQQPRPPQHHRYSGGDYSMSSSTTSISQKRPKDIQPRYLDISKYKSESSPRAFLRKDPSKTYIAALGDAKPHRPSQQKIEADIQPRYLDISKYKSESSPRAFLRKDPSKTYIAALGDAKLHRPSQQKIEAEQKKQELEKWKRRASYDPRKAAAQAKARPQPKTASSVLRSQSFHGPMLVSTSLRYAPPPQQILESCDVSSDNDF